MISNYKSVDQVYTESHRAATASNVLQYETFQAVFQQLAAGNNEEMNNLSAIMNNKYYYHLRGGERHRT